MATRDPAEALATATARKWGFVVGVVAPIAGAVASLLLAVPLGVTAGGLYPLLAAGAFTSTVGLVAMVRSRSPGSILGSVVFGEAILLGGVAWFVLMDGDVGGARLGLALIGAGTLMGTLMGHLLGARSSERRVVSGRVPAPSGQFERRRESELESKTRGWERSWILRRYWEDGQLEQNMELDRQILQRHGYDVTSPDETAALERSAHVVTRLFRFMVDANYDGVRVAFVRREQPEAGEGDVR